MPQLDGIRAIAVLFVMLFHFIPGVDRYLPLGGIGVRLFFVLSGFLITRILLASRDRPFADALTTFYARRFLRIFPLFYFALAAAALLNIGVVRSTLAWHLAYLTNFLIYSRGEWQGAVTHFWSLAVEEQFYLVWPCLVLTVPGRALPWVIATMIPIAPLSLWWLNDPMASVLPTACLDALGLGALLAIPSARRYVSAVGLWAGAPLLIVTMSMPGFHIGGVAIDTAMGFAVALVSAWFVSGAADGFTGAGRALLEWRPLMYLGTISYGVYVYHAFMPYLLGRWFPSVQLDLWPRFVLLATVTIVVASVSWLLLERPVLRLKKRF